MLVQSTICLLWVARFRSRGVPRTSTYLLTSSGGGGCGFEGFLRLMRRLKLMKIFRTELKLERSIAVICDTHISFLNGKKSKLYKDFSQMGRPFYKYIVHTRTRHFAK
jgi:hypothetical protein